VNEATAETYIPLLKVMTRLQEEGHPSKVTLGITPILAEQLSSESFREEFIYYVKNKIEAAKVDEIYFTRWNQPTMARLARMWFDFYGETLTTFQEVYHEDLIGQFKALQDAGSIEIITSAATHGYLPLIGYDACINAQIALGVSSYHRHFGRKPRGIWLPECAYRPRYRWAYPVGHVGEEKERKGVEEFLYEHGLEYFIVDSHLLEGGKALGVYLDRFDILRQLWAQSEKERLTMVNEKRSPHRTYLVTSSSTGEKAVAILTRDPQTSLQVWSGEHGYPGDAHYLDFHKKHFPGGHRYWRVTSPKSDLGEKKEYDPDAVEERLKENAGHFKDLVKHLLLEHFSETGRPGIVTAPFDTELFGHWWFEGTSWLYSVLKLIDLDPEIELVTGGEAIDRLQPIQLISLPEGSWGEGGFHWIWLNDWTKWTWGRVYEAEEKMIELVREYGETRDPDLQRILKQLARELLLLESSDWQFLISTFSARDYAELRFTEHYHDFTELAEMARKQAKGETLHQGEWAFFEDCEKKDTPFPDLNLNWWKEGGSRE